MTARQPLPFLIFDNQSLDERFLPTILADYVRCDKIGTSNFYWSFPADRTNRVCALIPQHCNYTWTNVLSAYGVLTQAQTRKRDVDAKVADLEAKKATAESRLEQAKENVPQTVSAAIRPSAKVVA